MDPFARVGIGTGEAVRGVDHRHAVVGGPGAGLLDAISASKLLACVVHAEPGDRPSKV
jgi:hypothetical protein